MRVSGISNAQIAQRAEQIAPTPVKPSVDAPSAGGKSFGESLMDAMHELNGAQADARKLQEAYMAGQPVEHHELMIAMERSSVSTQLAMQVRNKLLEAYQEISRMQI